MNKQFLQDHLEKLHAFKTIVEVGSISKAASILHISQSSLSHSVMTLEDAAGVALLERKSRGVTTTESGKVLFEFSKRLDLEIKSIETRILSPQDVNSGHLKIATHETLAVHVWPQFLKMLREKYPLINISLISGRVDAIVDGIVSRDYHLSVTVEPLNHPTIEKTELYSGCFGLYVASKGNCTIFPKLKKNKVSIEDINNTPVLTDTYAHIKQGLPIPRYLSELNIGDPFAYEVNSFEAAIRLAAQGLGIAAIPERNAQEAVRQKIIRKINIDEISKKNSFGKYSICAAYRKDTSSRHLVDMLIGELRLLFN